MHSDDIVIPGPLFHGLLKDASDGITEHQLIESFSQYDPRAVHEALDAIEKGGYVGHRSSSRHDTGFHYHTTQEGKAILEMMDRSRELLTK